MEIDEEMALRYYLTWRGAEDVSSYWAAIRDAREASGLPPDTGWPRPRVSGRWQGILGYLFWLDQIGSAIKPTDTSVQAQSSGFLTALDRWCAEQVTGEEREALYALRCSLAHDYSLANLGNRATIPGKDSRRHHFTLTADALSSVVLLPERQWTGLHDDRGKDTRTVVSAWSLTDLCEKVHLRIMFEYVQGRVSLALENYEGDNKAKELVLRYSFQVRPS